MQTLKVKNLVKKYEKFTAVNNLSFSIPERSIFGLLGPNGSGKTTTIYCILSLLKYSNGEIDIFGEEMHPNALNIKKEIGFVPQDMAVFKELTVYENIDYFCGLYITDSKQRKQYVEEAVAFVALEKFTKHYPNELSGGLQRRLNIACGIAHKPKFIIFDEPTVAVDPQSRNQILENIQKLNDQGATILYTSHYMEEIAQLCDHILIMDNGEEIAQGTQDELINQSSIASTLTIETYDISPEQMQQINQLPTVNQVDYDGSSLKISYRENDDLLYTILAFFKQEKLSHQNIKTEVPTLNDVFLEITGKELRD